jgi:hypothetical protein
MIKFNEMICECCDEITYDIHIPSKGVIYELGGKDEMVEFLKWMTDEKNQSVFKEEMGKMRMMKDVIERVEKSLGGKYEE